MAIKRYKAEKDTTISNAYSSNLTTKATGSNMGGSDVLEIFSIYGQNSSSVDGQSIEKSRILCQFPISNLVADRNSNKIPDSGQVQFYLKIFNAEHSQTLPKDFTLEVAAVSQSWEEGRGLDMEDYSDIGYANWLSPASSSGPEVLWDTAGGTFLTASQYSSYIYSQNFPNGTEDLEINVTSLVEKWISEDLSNYGFAIYLTSSQEDGSAFESYYTKKLFSRTSEFFNKRPMLESRWNSSIGDDSSNFYLSSSLAPAGDNLNTIYFYNTVRGKHENIPSLTDGIIHLSMYDSIGGNKIGLPVGGGVVTSGDLNVTGGVTQKGFYSASFAYTSSENTTAYPVWHLNNTEYFTGSSVSLKTFGQQRGTEYISTVTNLKHSYSNNENVRIRLFTRIKDWSPTIYTKAVKKITPEIVEKIFYTVERTVDKLPIVSYGTGSENHTLLSYDASGGYFDLDMNIFEKGYSYDIKFLFYINDEYKEQTEVFKFRVE
jgi:hypothetical protein